MKLKRLLRKKGGLEPFEEHLSLQEYSEEVIEKWLEFFVADW